MSDARCWVGLDADNVVQAIHVRDSPDAKAYVAGGGLRPCFLDIDLARHHLISKEPVPYDVAAAPAKPDLARLWALLHTCEKGEFYEDHDESLDMLFAAWEVYYEIEEWLR